MEEVSTPKGEGSERERERREEGGGGGGVGGILIENQGMTEEKIEFIRNGIAPSRVIEGRRRKKRGVGRAAALAEGRDGGFRPEGGELKKTRITRWFFKKKRRGGGGHFCVMASWLKITNSNQRAGGAWGQGRGGETFLERYSRSRSHASSCRNQ